MRHCMLMIGFFLVNALFAGEIIVTNNFKHIEQAAEELNGDSLILFDVDGTLIIPKDAILHPHAKNLFKQLVASYTDRDLFREIRMKAPHVLVDAETVGFVQKMHQQKIPTIAFTAAPAKIYGVEEIGLWRVDELKHYGYDFSSAFPAVDLLEWPKEDNSTHFPMYRGGVLYSSFHPKGDILVAFLKMLSLKPNKIIFVDDELVHVQSVIESLNDLGIPCIGFHYTTANEARCDLNPERAQFQIDYFVQHDVWLEDLNCENYLSKGF